MGTTPVLMLNVRANENAKVNTRSQESNSGPYDCKAYAIPHDHGHHTKCVFRAKQAPNCNNGVFP